METNMEVATHLVDQEWAFKLASFVVLIRILCFLDIVCIIWYFLVVVNNLNNFTTCIKSVLHKISFDVDNMSAYYVLHIYWQNVARSLRELKVNVDL